MRTVREIFRNASLGDFDLNCQTRDRQVNACESDHGFEKSQHAEFTQPRLAHCSVPLG